MNDPIHLRIMRRADLPFADALRERVGWNQTIRDWENFLELSPDGCLIAEWQAQPAGTAITVRFGAELAWIGMLLVHPDCRRHGIGRALLDRCLGFLRGCGISCIRLDATPEGKLLYDQLGFVAQWSITRWQIPRLPHQGTGVSPPIRPIEELDWGAVVALDKETFGVNRARLLEKLRDGAACTFLHESHGAVAGYGMLRNGARAAYLGPVAARSPTAGIQLVERLLAAVVSQPVYWDIPNANSAATALAQELGFTPQRSLVRMAHGSAGSPGRPGHYFAIADPAVG